MNNLNVFFTPQQTANSGQNYINTGVAPDNGASLATDGTITIFDLLMQGLVSEDGEEGILQGDGENGLLKPTSKTQDELIAILANTDQIAENVEGLGDIAGLDTVQKIEHTLAMNQQIIDNILRAGTGNDELTINPETGELIQPDPAFFNMLNMSPQKFEALMQQIDAALQGEEFSLEGLGLSVEEFNQILTQVEAFENAINGLSVTMSDVSTNTEGYIKGDTVNPAAVTTALQGLSKAAGGYQALTPGGGAPEGIDLAGDALRQYAGNPIAENLGQKVANGALVQDIANNAAANGNAANQNGQPAFNLLQSWPFAASGSLYAFAGYGDQLAEELGLSLNGRQNIAQGSLTALVSQSQSAIHPHPATQMVAANMQRIGVNGETNISLQLDPPDLGRVDVQMTFGKDKTVKALVMVEKPETYMMLQRDAQVLERALQDAGLDSEGGLSFELAQDGEFFDRDNQRGGGHDSGGTGSGASGDGEDLDIIETTMTWHVDPETGHMRYNILV